MKTIREKMAEAMIAIDYPDGDYNEVTMGDDKHLYLKHAQAVLDVVLGELESMHVSNERLLDFNEQQGGAASFDELLSRREAHNAALKAAADRLRG